MAQGLSLRIASLPLSSHLQKLNSPARNRVVCEEGHLLQGYVQETNESQEGSQFVTQARRFRKNRIKKVKPPTNDYFHGERATFLLWQCLQWILREQVRIMIEELGYPEELEPVTRELWTMLLASSGAPAAPKDHLTGDEPAGSYSGPREGARYYKLGRKKGGKHQRDKEGSDEEVRSESEGEAKDSADSDDEADTEEEIVPEPTKEEEDDLPDQPEGPTPRPPPNLYAPPKPPRRAPAPAPGDPRERPRLDHLLNVLYLACITLRLPVTLHDILLSVLS